ncbi:MAG: Mur ligase domain-containing protein [Patescibacteria group bacterium]
MEGISDAKHIHFIGIGGIGVSALARMMLHHGKAVSGSDRTLSRITEDLSRLGARISEGHRKENIGESVDVVIYSPAITDDNPELAYARAQRIETMSYPQALGRISENAYTIAVSGTHGKTTTTAMIADVLRAHVDPTVIVGSLLSGGRSNFVPGDARRFVVEACEYKRSFLSLSPSILVITNIDADHLDYYKDLEDIESAFRELAQKVPPHGFIVCDLDNPSTRRALRGSNATIVNYKAFHDSNRKLGVMGNHNRMNASVAHAVADIFGIDKNHTDVVLEKFKGTWRRSEHKGMHASGASVFDDYGHHPTEIKTTIHGFRERFPKHNLTVVFQPHLYSRTRHHFGDFAESFDHADRVLLAPIYAAREKDEGIVSHHELADAIRKRNVRVESYDSLDAVKEELTRSIASNDLVLTMGAGDIYEVGEHLL